MSEGGPTSDEGEGPATPPQTARVYHLREGIEVASPGHADEHVVAELERLLLMAKSGEMSGIAYSVACADTSCEDGFVGVISMTMVGGLFSVMSRVSQRLDQP